jgi:adenosylcobinamide-GDP ribazoletransferase
MNDTDAHAQATRPASALLAHARAPVTALAFLTRIPVRHADLSPSALARALPWFPVVGVLIGALQALLGYFAMRHLPAAFVAVCVVALGAALTGALHLDGLADVFDGLGGARGDRRRALAIMRDSRIGSVGATALLLLVAAKLAVLPELFSYGAERAVLLAPLVARAAVVPLIVWLPYARPEGLGHAFHTFGRGWHAVAALGFALASTWLAYPRCLAALVATQLAILLFAVWIQRRLGGLTGDVYGAAIELGELAFLTASLL